jgi:anti-sigma factor RsiW
MECRDVQEQLTGVSEAQLPGDVAAAVRAHLARCATCREALQATDRLRGLIRAHTPRFTAPAALRARVRDAWPAATRTRPTGWRGRVRSHPWLAGTLAGAVAALVLFWAGTSWIVRDPVSRLLAQAVEEHLEYAREAMDRPAPDARDLIHRVASQAAFPLGSVFAGDAETLLISAVTSDLHGKAAVALVYRNATKRYTTLVLMPGADVTIPAENRLPIEQFTPYHRVASGKHVFYWKQRDLACLLVSDLDQSGLADMFLKIRKAG